MEIDENIFDGPGCCMISQLKPGDVFQYGDDLYLKITNHIGECNGVRLRDGELYHLSSRCKIIKKDVILLKKG